MIDVPVPFVCLSDSDFRIVFYKFIIFNTLVLVSSCCAADRRCVIKFSM